MSGLVYTLIGDGSSDRLLVHPIRWAVASLGVRIEQGQWADLSVADPRPASLVERARTALRMYPAELLFVHRDAEKEPFDKRIAEIRTALASMTTRSVAVVPVRMTEAWLLHDVQAIRRASNNPNGRVALSIPSLPDVKNAPDPKSILENALLDASEFTGRRRDRRRAELPRMRARTAELIVDFSPLKTLPAFRAFIDELASALVELGHLSSDG